MTIQRITEAQGSPVTLTGARMRVRLISAGKGSSGTYPADAIEAAGRDVIFRQGMHLYLDHPSVTESFDRPERSVKDLAAVLESDAEWNAEDSALDADVHVFPAYRETLHEMKDHIGLSIRASAEVEESKDGGRVIKRLVEAQSVDFVTKAGRGGKVLEVLESARDRIVSSAKEAGVAEAVANDVSSWLSKAVSKANSGQYVWVRDFDPDYVYFDLESPTTYRTATYRHAYTQGDGDVTLTGDPEEVNRETVYKPVNTPDTTPPVGTTTESHKEDEMPNIQEGKNTPEPVTEAARIAALEAQVAESRTRELAAIKRANQAAAERVVAEAFNGMDVPRTVARIVESAVAEAGEDAIDAEALRESAVAEAAELYAATGAGRPNGLGGGNTPTGVTESDTNKSIAAAFGRPIKES